MQLFREKQNMCLQFKMWKIKANQTTIRSSLQFKSYFPKNQRTQKTKQNSVDDRSSNIRIRNTVIGISWFHDNHLEIPTTKETDRNIWKNQQNNEKKMETDLNSNLQYELKEFQASILLAVEATITKEIILIHSDEKFHTISHC